MSGVGPPAIRPRPYAWRRRSTRPPICLGLGPQPHGPAHPPGGDEPPWPALRPICLGLGPQLCVPEPWPEANL
eukprot:gene20357-biopygen20601